MRAGQLDSVEENMLNRFVAAFNWDQSHIWSFLYKVLRSVNLLWKLWTFLVSCQSCNRRVSDLVIDYDMDRWSWHLSVCVCCWTWRLCVVNDHAPRADIVKDYCVNQRYSPHTRKRKLYLCNIAQRSEQQLITVHTLTHIVGFWTVRWDSSRTLQLKYFMIYALHLHKHSVTQQSTPRSYQPRVHRLLRHY